MGRGFESRLRLRFAPASSRQTGRLTQYEQENDLGRGGGEVDEETTEQALPNADERRGTANLGNDDNPGPEPWAKTSSGDTATP